MNIKLVNCPACQNAVSHQAWKCPACGQPLRSAVKIFFKYVAALVFALVCAAVLYQVWWWRTAQVRDAEDAGKGLDAIRASLPAK